jgi:hypothetical protein
MLLMALETAQSIGDMDVPGFNLHPLRGRGKGRCSIWVNGNWRETFEFRNGSARRPDISLERSRQAVSDMCRIPVRQLSWHLMLWKASIALPFTTSDGAPWSMK